MKDISVIDIFSGIGGLTHGLFLEGFNIIAGFDADEGCRYAYEKNTPGARFIHKKIQDIKMEEIIELYPTDSIKVLVGCAPCQPFSKYTKNQNKEDERWELIPDFGKLICAVNPDIVSMENVPNLKNYNEGRILKDFINNLEANDYYVTTYPNVYAPDYGIPQNRTRLVLFASKYGPLELIEKTHSPDEYKTVRETIEALEPLRAGGTNSEDPLHKACGLSEKNLKRIRASKPGGTWEDWNGDLIAECHLKSRGRRYKSVYGRMEWNAPSPTITTQFHGYGNGRFGHPEQDRAISLREGALLQTFPKDYEFVAPGKPRHFTNLGKYIGNAVPVKLAMVIGISIKDHLSYYSE